MDAHASAARAYQGARTTSKTPRQIEYEAFARATNALGEAARAEGPDAFPRLAAALHENLKLWTVIAGAVAFPENGLPEGLRAGLFSLAEFTRQHTRRVLAREAEAAPLIDINMNVMRGLRARREVESCQV